VFYINIKVFVSYCKKNLIILQIYLYNLNVCFWSGSNKFQIKFDNIYTLFIIYQIQKKLPDKYTGLNWNPEI